MKIFIILFWLNLLPTDADTDVVRITVYHAVEAQTNSDPSHTAFMFKLDLNNPYKHRIIAVSRDLLGKYPRGTKVRIKGTSYDGVYTVRDKMGKTKRNRNKATKTKQPRIPITNSIDILINTDMKIGMWENATITKI